MNGQEDLQEGDREGTGRSEFLDLQSEQVELYLLRNNPSGFPRENSDMSPAHLSNQSGTSIPAGHTNGYGDLSCINSPAHPGVNSKRYLYSSGSMYY